MTIEAKFHMCVANVFALQTPAVTPAPEAALPSANLLDSKRQSICRVTGSPDPIAIKGSSATEYTAGCFAIHNHNFATDVTVRVRLFADINQTGATNYDSTALSAWITIPWGTMIPGIDPWGDVYDVGTPRMYAVYFDAVAFKSYQIDIVNPTAVSVDMGLIYGGWNWVPTQNASFGQAIDWVDNSRQTRTAGGGQRTEDVDAYRRIEMQLDGLTDSERATLSHLLELQGKSGDILISLDPTDVTRMVLENTMICHRVINNRISRVGYSRGSAPMVFEEI